MPLLWGCYGLCAVIEAQQRGVGWVGPGVPDSGLGRGLTRLRDHAPARTTQPCRLLYPCRGDLGDSAMCFVHPRVLKERASGASLAHLDLRDPLASATRGARGLLGPQALQGPQAPLPFLALTGRVSPVGSGPELQPCPAGAAMFPPLVLSHSYQRSWSPRSTWPPRTPWNHGHLLRGKCLCPLDPHCGWDCLRGALGGPHRDPNTRLFCPVQAHRSPELWFRKQKWGAGGQLGLRWQGEDRPWATVQRPVAQGLVVLTGNWGLGAKPSPSRGRPPPPGLRRAFSGASLTTRCPLKS